VFGINSAGQAVGNSDTAYGGFAFRTAPGQPINPTTDNLGAFGTGAITATGINTQGQVVGFSPTGSDLGQRAFRTAPNAAINPVTDNLGTLGGDTSVAHGINDSGQVVGTSSPDDGDLAAFRTSPNAPINPATDNLGAASYGYGINNSGQVVGCFYIGGGQYRAFRTKANSAINAATDDLGDLGGASSPSSPNNCARGVNDAGQAVGWANAVDGHVHAFRTAPNAAINPATDNLGTLGGTDSVAESINASGQVVGFVVVGPDTNRAFIYSNGVMQDLNSLIPAHSGWILAVAYGINDAGQIVGVDPSGNHAFRLDPYSTYGVCLLYDPDKDVKAGSTIPIKLQLCDNNGNNLSSPNTTVHAVGVAQVSNVVSGVVQDSGNANPDNDFRFDSSLGVTGGYIFNLSTVGLTTGTYKINFNVGGGPSLYSAPFQVK
jgi:probable HAF family extracellular repeat protein